MSKRGMDFVEHWVSENINPEAYAPGGDTSQAEENVRLMLEDAEKFGVSEKEIEEDMGDLADFMASAMEESTDAEIRRLAAKDD